MLKETLDKTVQLLDKVIEEKRAVISLEEKGKVLSVENSIATLQGLPRVKNNELIEFEGGATGIAFNLDENEIGVIILEEGEERIKAGATAYRTKKVTEIPVGESLLGRVIDAIGNPLDNKGQIHYHETRPIEREAPAIMERAPVNVPLQTGIKVIDALIPIGRGQRELILGDRQTGKTAIALDTIINQHDKNVICIYCAIGQRTSSVANFLSDLQNYNALSYTVVLVAEAERNPGLQYISPYAATTIAEYFMEKGEDVLIIYDDLTRHARSYRELSLLLERPPGREAYPGDIFYLHSRLLERSTHLINEKGGGSLTALPIIETQAQNLSAYIPTNLISITDGQIYLSPDLYRKGNLPAVDVGKSVSRVGGKTQLPAYRRVVGDLRLSYSQFQELETFSRFGTRLDEKTRKSIERGRRIREVLNQSQYEPIPVWEQIAILLAVTEGILDNSDISEISSAEIRIRRVVSQQLPEISKKIVEGKVLDKEDWSDVLRVIKNAINNEEEE